MPWGGLELHSSEWQPMSPAHAWCQRMVEATGWVLAEGQAGTRADSSQGRACGAALKVKLLLV